MTNDELIKLVETLESRVQILEKLYAETFDSEGNKKPQEQAWSTFNGSEYYTLTSDSAPIVRKISKKQYNSGISGPIGATGSSSILRMDGTGLGYGAISSMPIEEASSLLAQSREKALQTEIMKMRRDNMQKLAEYDRQVKAKNQLFYGSSGSA